MYEYDVWVLNRDYVASVMMPLSKCSDFEAIQTAREMAGWQPFELWSDRGCICVGGEGRIRLQPYESAA
jgi:hypothetical protein